jgi:hypothetical protein
MKLSKKDKSKILVKHLERDFELVSRCGETYVIMSIMDALSEIESVEDDECPNGRGGDLYARIND